MRVARHNFAFHLAMVVGAGAVLILCVVYPFLPGRYDSLAVSLSTMAQVFGVVGLPLVVVGLDYDPAIVGLERYHYSSQGDAYNLSFEQPRFLLDRLGTREWVV